jgi:hypothetical protein
MHILMKKIRVHCMTGHLPALIASLTHAAVVLPQIQPSGFAKICHWLA